MLCWHWNSLKAVQRSARTQITDWFKKLTAHRPGNHTVGGSLLPTGRDSSLPLTEVPLPKENCQWALVLWGGKGHHFFHLCFTDAWEQWESTSARGCINGMLSLSCFGRPNCVWGLIITNVEKARLTHFTFGQSFRRNRIAALHNIQGYLFVSLPPINSWALPPPVSIDQQTMPTSVLLL